MESVNKGLIIGVLVVLGLGIVGGGYWWMRSKPSLENDVIMNGNVVLPTVEPTNGPAKTGVVKEFTVTGSDFKFEPSEIRVKKGDNLKIIFKNGGGTHDFVIDEFGVATSQIEDEEEEEMEFTVDKAGTFEYYCSVGKHRQMGMVGKLIVE